MMNEPSYTPTRLHRLGTALLVAWIVGGSVMLLVLGALMSWAR